MNSAQLHEGLMSLGVPGLIGLAFSAGCLWLSNWPGFKDNRTRWATRLEVLGVVLGLGVAYVFVYARLRGFEFASPSASSRQTYVLIAAVLASIIEAMTTRATRQPMVRWFGRLAIVGLVVGYQIASIRRNWDAGSETYAWHIGVGLWMLLAFGALDFFGSRARLGLGALTLASLPMLAMPALFAAGASSGWQIAMGVGAALLGIALAGVFFRERHLGRAIGTIFVVWLSGTIIETSSYIGEMERWKSVVLACTPFLLVIAMVIPKLKPWTRTLVALVLVSAASIAISAESVGEFYREMTGSGPVDEFDIYGVVEVIDETAAYSTGGMSWLGVLP